jgi:hypothetical protein
MKQELDRLKQDIETLRQAAGLAPSFSRAWIQWMHRDKWFNLWWCVPGVIVIAATLLPLGSQPHLGLVPQQWAGLLVAAVLLGIAIRQSRRASGGDGRPNDMVRESRRNLGLTRQGAWFGIALFVQMAAYTVWAMQHQLAFEPFWAGLFLMLGSTCLVAALCARAWFLLGYAIPFMLYGLCLPLARRHPTADGILLGMMFICVALCFSAIQVWEIRKVERQNESH